MVNGISGVIGWCEKRKLGLSDRLGTAQSQDFSRATVSWMVHETTSLPLFHEDQPWVTQDVSAFRESINVRFQ